MSTVETRRKQHTIIESPLGELTIVGEGDALTGLDFADHQYAPDRLTFGPRTDSGFEAVTSQLDSYFAGRQANFYLELAPRGNDFQRMVWNLVNKVPYGSTTTYGAIAAQIGGDVTARDVGTAVARNPLCILIPCHRVIGSDGAPYRLRRRRGPQAPCSTSNRTHGSPTCARRSPVGDPAGPNDRESNASPPPSRRRHPATREGWRRVAARSIEEIGAPDLTFSHWPAFPS